MVLYLFGVLKKTTIAVIAASSRTIQLAVPLTPPGRIEVTQFHTDMINTNTSSASTPGHGTLIDYHRAVRRLRYDAFCWDASVSSMEVSYLVRERKRRFGE